MDRRRVVVALGLAIATTAFAQPARAKARIGYLSPGTRGRGYQAAFVEGLLALGWAEGRNLVIEYRFADDRPERLPSLAAELAAMKVDLIVAQPTAAAVAARNATATIPIVMINTGEPVKLGLVASLARPGGNVTGTAFDVGLETFGKALELLKAALANVRRIAMLSNPDNPSQPLAIAHVERAARALRLEVLAFEARRSADLPDAYRSMAAERPDALFVFAESLFLNERVRIAQLALEHRLATMCGLRDNVTAGALMSYGPSLADNSRRAAAYVDRILKGAKPAELPVEQPRRFELVVNLKTAAALGISIAGPVLERADEVIR